MAHNLGSLDLTNAEKASTWLLAFSALARAKQWRDVPAVSADPENNVAATAPNLVITDNFLANCGLVTLEKLQYIVVPRQIDSLSFETIKTAVQAYLAPKTKLVIAERAKFYNTKQMADESVVDFTARLRKAVQFCDFDRLKTSADPTEEMVLAALIAGLSKMEQSKKILEHFQSNMALSVSQVIEQIQQMEQVKYFVQDLPLGTSESQDQGTRIDEIHFQKISNCKFCGSSHVIRKCPAYGKKCSYCQKPNHFAIICKSKTKVSSAHMHAVDDSSSNHVLFISRD